MARPAVGTSTGIRGATTRIEDRGPPVRGTRPTGCRRPPRPSRASVAGTPPRRNPTSARSVHSRADRSDRRRPDRRGDPREPARPPGADASNLGGRDGGRLRPVLGAGSVAADRGEAPAAGGRATAAEPTLAPDGRRRASRGPPVAVE